MSWEAFLGALLPGLLSVLYARAAYLKSITASDHGAANGRKLDTLRADMGSGLYTAPVRPAVLPPRPTGAITSIRLTPPQPPEDA